jgi:hypothetical protein
VRIQEGDYAYDIEQMTNPSTQVRQQWKFSIYQVFPAEQMLERGEAESREEAEAAAQAAIVRIRSQSKRKASAA